MRHAFSLLQLLFALALLGVLGALAAGPYRAVRDRAAVQAAATAGVAAFDAMRTHALTHGRHAALRIDTAAARLVLHAGSDTVLQVPLAAWRVRLAATRDSTGVAPDGLGFGAANLRLVVWRGQAAETISVSRLGRVSRR